MIQSWANHDGGTADEENRLEVSGVGGGVKADKTTMVGGKWTVLSAVPVGMLTLPS